MSSSITSPQIENEATSASGSESKKRNKLGYHRSAVACGHCRRRKIRCIASPSENESRCQNCIRLRKECQYFPIEGDGSIMRKSKSETRIEASASDWTKLKNSPSPELGTSTIQESYSTSAIPDTAQNTMWKNAPDLVASPTDIGNEHKHEQGTWNIGSSQDCTQSLYHPQRNHFASVLPSAYWIAHDPSVTAYQPQQYGVVNDSVPQPQDHQLVHRIQEYDGSQHSAARRSLSSMHTHSMVQAPNTYNSYDVSFPDIQRTMTMPAMHNHAGQSAGMDTQVSRQLGPEQGQYMYHPSFPTQPAPSEWYSPPSDQQAFAPHYLPSQHDHGSNHSDWPE